jgi:hypothetical protein
MVKTITDCNEFKLRWAFLTANVEVLEITHDKDNYKKKYYIVDIENHNWNMNSDHDFCA